MHAAALESVGVDARYDAIRVPAGRFDVIVAMLRDGRLDGVNVTMPHKTDAYESVNELTSDARRARAVNTITVQHRHLVGTNTDIAGVGHALGLLGMNDDTPVAILGAGGAARAAAIAMETRHLTVSSRAPERAAALLRSLGITGDVVEWGKAVPDAILINATPIGMLGDSLPEPLLDAAVGFVDLAYGSTPTGSIRYAAAADKPVADGIDMLVGQAVEAFTVFTGRTVDPGVFEAAARAV